MKALIDIGNPVSRLKLFDISLTERILRQLWVRGIRDAYLCGNTAISFKKEFYDRFPMTLKTIKNDEFLKEPNSEWLILDGWAIYDDRVMDLLVNAQSSVRITDSQNDSVPKAFKIISSGPYSTALDIYESIGRSDFNMIDIQTMDSYIPFLRKSYVPVLRFLSDNEDLTKAENDLFDKTFKSGLEWIAIYGYKIPVRELTRLCAKTSITPNQITAVAMICRWISIPLLFMHWIGLGLFLVAAFIILDSLDGKLARMTFRFSDQADWIDHGSVLPTRLGWYAGLGWHFSGGDYSNAMGLLALVTLVFIVLDDINWAIAKRLFKRTLFDITDFDSKMHLYTHRRNDIFLMLLGYLIGFGIQSFIVICLWVLTSWLWHSGRILYAVNVLKLNKQSS